ncbi:MAG: Lrp/AsnC family transcriptional regulator [Nanoarchaeota archaeon]
MKLDLKDRRILYELDRNARASNVEIAKKAGISKQVAGFRIKRLITSKMLTKFHTIIDISTLGYTVHKLFFRLQNLDKHSEENLIAFLLRHPSVVWIAGCDGRFDLACGVWAENVETLDHTLAEFTREFGECIAERQIATILRGEYLPRDYLLGERRLNKQRPSFGAVAAPSLLRELDWKILHMLGKDARVSAVEIATSIKVNAETVSNHIHRLEKIGVIRGYTIVPNEELYPYLHYKILIGLKNSSEEQERSFRSFCQTHPSIVYLVKSLGPWEFEVDLEVEDSKKLRVILMEMKTEFKDVLKDYSTLSLYKVYNYNFCPSIKET